MYPRGRGWGERVTSHTFLPVWKTCWAAIVDCCCHWSMGVKDRNHSTQNSPQWWTHACTLATQVFTHRVPRSCAFAPHLPPNLQPRAHPITREILTQKHPKVQVFVLFLSATCVLTLNTQSNSDIQDHKQVMVEYR